MSITDRAGHTIIGRHPELGFLIDGDVRRDIAENLCRLGFRRTEDDVLVPPTDLPEAQARDLVARAAQALRVTGHRVTVLSDEQAGELAVESSRWDEVLGILTTGRQQLLAGIRELHPTPRCLPVPELRIPQTREQLDEAIDMVRANLFITDGRLTMWHVCDHTPGHAGVVAKELVSRWHFLLLACREYLDGGCATVPYNPTGAAAHLEAGARSMIAPPRDHFLQLGTVGQLADGDEFSLDGGTTWHVCSVVLSGTVSVYTGEHNTEGEPLRAEVDANPGRPCLVRRSLTA